MLVGSYLFEAAAVMSLRELPLDSAALANYGDTQLDILLDRFSARSGCEAYVRFCWFLHLDVLPLVTTAPYHHSCANSFFLLRAVRKGGC